MKGRIWAPITFALWWCSCDYNKRNFADVIKVNSQLTLKIRRLSWIIWVDLITRILKSKTFLSLVIEGEVRDLENEKYLTRLCCLEDEGAMYQRNKRPQSYNQKEFNSSNDVTNLGSRFFARAFRKEPSPADTLILALGVCEQRTQLSQTVPGFLTHRTER